MDAIVIGSIFEGIRPIRLSAGFIRAQYVYGIAEINQGLHAIYIQLIELFHHAEDAVKIAFDLFALFGGKFQSVEMFES